MLANYYGLHFVLCIIPCQNACHAQYFENTIPFDVDLAFDAVHPERAWPGPAALYRG